MSFFGFRLSARQHQSLTHNPTQHLHSQATESSRDMSSLSPLIGGLTSLGRAEEVVERITEAIHLGLLNDGEQLPVEVDFARLFGVAPMTAREALAELRAKGLVETKRGRTGGSFVRRPAGPPIDFLRAKLAALTVSEIRDLGDEQSAVTGQTARLAADRASATNIRRLFGLTEQLGAATSLQDQTRADARFHIELALGSQSERLTRREVALQAEVSGLLWLPMDPPISVADIVAEHHAIAVAIVAEDREKARQLAEEHVASNVRRLVLLNMQLNDGKEVADHD